MTTSRKSSRRVLAAAIAIGVLTGVGTAGSAQAYPPQPPTDERSLEVTSLGPDCEIDVPHVVFAVEPVGFESSGPTLVTVRDLDGNVLENLEFAGLSGSFVYPGASVGEDGRATDWPGWKLEDGTWVPDASDARLRDGLNVTFQVNPSVTAFVSYPGADSGCAGPPAVASSASGTPTQAALPSTGNSGMSPTLLAGAIALLLGIALTSWNAVSNRRRSAADASLG